MLISNHVILNIILPIILLIFAGIIARKSGKFTTEQGGNLINFVMNISIPSMIIVALADEPIVEYVHYLSFFITFLFITIIIFIIALIYARLCKKQPTLEGFYFAATACLSNNCMIAFPILIFIMGPTGAAYGILGVVVLILGLQTMSIIYEWQHNNKNTARSKRVAKTL